MTTENKVRENTDYSASAVNLGNNLTVIAKLGDLEALRDELNKCRAEAEALIPQDIKDRISEYVKAIADCEESLRMDIDTFGSYQNVKQGRYAVKQRKESISYKPELVRQYAPAKVVSFVIVEAVDAKAMDALIKAGQVTQEDARKCGEVKESFAYIIK
jgi:hypothetical protein